MRPYMSILCTKYTYKIDNFVYIFVFIVYKIGTKFDPKNYSAIENIDTK